MSDIATHKGAQQELAETDARFRTVLNQASVGVVQTDATGRMTMVNQRWCQMLGYSESELLGMSLAGVTDPATLEPTLAAVRRLAEGGSDFDIEKRYLRKDGSLLWASSSVNALRTPEGEYLGLVAVVLDITEQHRRQALAHGQKQAFELALNGAPINAVLEILARAAQEQSADSARVAIFFVDGEASCLRFGAAVGMPESYTRAIDGFPIGPQFPSCGMAAYTGQTVIVRDVAQDPLWAPYLHLAQDAAFRACWSFPIRSFGGKVLGTLALYHTRPCEPDSRDLEFVSLLADTAAVLIARHRDITERKRAEDAFARLTAQSEQRRRLYETILLNTPDLIYVFDLDHRFTYANEALLEVWGRTWDDAIGKNCLELGYEPWQAAMHDREIEQVIATKQPIRGEVPFAGTHGRRIYDYVFGPVLGVDGEVEAITGTTRDITEHKQAEELLREADRRKDEFIATLAHELRNPLAPLRNGLQVMKVAGSNGETIEQCRAMMERQLTQLVRLVDDLMDVSRINNGKMDLRLERIAISAVIESAVETSRPLIDARRHQLTFVLPSEPLFVDGDLTRLAQVVANLLNNAAKYTEPGGQIAITVESRNSQVVMRVRDSGVGIPASMLPSIFDMFMQVEHPLSRTQGGLGIGLTLAQRLVEMHGGSIGVSSDGAGKGSEFTVRLPLPADVTSALSHGSKSAPTRAPPTPRRILVADDNRDAADSLAVLLRLAGHDVSVVNDGLEALEKANAVRPEVIFMDIGMPKLNGYDTARRIREQPWGKRIHLVALTGWGQEEDKRRAMESGFQHHLMKPVEFAALERVLPP